MGVRWLVSESARRSPPLFGLAWEVLGCSCAQDTSEAHSAAAISYAHDFLLMAD
jgi:hypothetical protein